MNLKEIYSENIVLKNGFTNEKKPIITFEIFPPKNIETTDSLQKLYKELEVLKNYNPALVSVTYGAGGSNKDLSFEIVKHLKRNMKFEVMPHFTCVCSSREHIGKSLNELESLNIENVLALRGDESKDIQVCYKDFKYASDLVRYVKYNTELSVAVAGYPEGHIDAPDIFTDIEHLKQKVDLGGDVVYTQLFFDNDKFFNFIQLACDAGVNVPIIPGILPILSYQQLEKMVKLTNVTIPKTLMDRIERFKDSTDDVKKLGVEFASYQCQQLIDSGVKGIHFYTLNKADSCAQILDNLSVY